jgi:hypothetical protein
MPRKDNSRYRTLMKLFGIGKGDETSISKLQIEDLETITEDKDVQNIILLRKYVKERNTLEYLKEDEEHTKKDERKEET